MLGDLPVYRRPAARGPYFSDLAIRIRADGGTCRRWNRCAMAPGNDVLERPAVRPSSTAGRVVRGDSWVQNNGDAMTTQSIERSVERAAADLEPLFPGRYLSVTSFKRDGTGVATPVWFVSNGSRLFALTDLHSAKVRRIRRNPRVLIASCRADGKLRSEPVPARAEVLTATTELERVQK